MIFINPGCFGYIGNEHILQQQLEPSQNAINIANDDILRAILISDGILFVIDLPL